MRTNNKVQLHDSASVNLGASQLSNVKLKTLENPRLHTDNASLRKEINLILKKSHCDSSSQGSFSNINSDVTLA